MQQSHRDARGNSNEYVKGFWNKAFGASPPSGSLISDTDDTLDTLSVFDKYFWSLIGDVKDLDILEIGCGRGDDTLRYVRNGARVTTIDISDVAVDVVRQRLLAANLIADVQVMDVLDLTSVETRFDLIVGRYILHHLEPFDEISALLADHLKADGRMVFAENNARNPLLIFARAHLAGRYGIPKHGDNEEYPLTKAEVSMLATHFSNVACHFPSLVFFRKLNTYLFRHKKLFRPMMWLLDKLDDALWFIVPPLRPFSYVQIVATSKPRRL